MNAASLERSERLQSDFKYCGSCGKHFYKRPKDSRTQWESRLFCSITCNNRSRGIKSPLHIRFWEKVDRGMPHECWSWTGTKDQDGYGKITVAAGASPMKASRLAWELLNGKMPDELHACHHCDNPSCVNPAHIFPGTQKENMLDCSKKSRLNPKSLMNLRPGAKGVRGAGPLSNEEIYNAEGN